MGHDDEKLSPQMAVLGMVNGMIGGLILILPVYALNAGYVLSLIVILFTCAFSYFSCYLCVIHMGDQPDLDYAIFRHFNGNRVVKIFYDLCVWSNLLLIDMLYIELITIQWAGLVHDTAIPDWVNPTVNVVILLVLVFVLKYFEFGASVMAYGIVSIISYLLFLIWVVATYNQGYEGNELKPFG
jgi:amino acid permease